MVLSANNGTIKAKRGVAAPLQQRLTESRAAIGIGPPLLLAFAGFLLPCCPLLRKKLRDNTGACWHLDRAIERADGPLIDHGAIDVPALANVQEADQFKRARIFSTSSLLGWKGLMPGGNSDGELHALKALELGPVTGAGELLYGVVDDCHGRKAREGVAALELPKVRRERPEAQASGRFVKELSQRPSWALEAAEHELPQPFAHAARAMQHVGRLF